MLIFAVVIAVAGRHPRNACAYDCETCFRNVDDDMQLKLDNCNASCSNSSHPATCLSLCYDAYKSGRCAQMRALCAGCRIEIDIACDTQN
jgi:hypothetical protein